MSPIVAIPKSKFAYTTVLEGPDRGRDKSGWYLGLATRDEPGYNQLKPGYGPYKNEKAAREHADELNSKLGLTSEEACLIVLSTIGAQNREEAQDHSHSRR